MNAAGQTRPSPPHIAAWKKTGRLLALASHERAALDRWGIGVFDPLNGSCSSRLFVGSSGYQRDGPLSETDAMTAPSSTSGRRDYFARVYDRLATADLPRDRGVARGGPSRGAELDIG